jgi:hypothetical protein
MLGKPCYTSLVGKGSASHVCRRPLNIEAAWSHNHVLRTPLIQEAQNIILEFGFSREATNVWQEIPEILLSVHSFHRRTQIPTAVKDFVFQSDQGSGLDADFERKEHQQQYIFGPLVEDNSLEIFDTHPVTRYRLAYRLTEKGIAAQTQILQSFLHNGTLPPLPTQVDTLRRLSSSWAFAEQCSTKNLSEQAFHRTCREWKAEGLLVIEKKPAEKVHPPLYRLSPQGQAAKAALIKVRKHNSPGTP